MTEQNIIAAERTRYRMSQDDLALELGVTRRTVQNYENGGDIPASKVVKMTRIFGVTSDYLLGLSNIPHATGA